MKKITAILTSLVLLLSGSLPAFAATTSASQITSSGGSKTADNVTFSKTIAGTSIENIFDITLKVTTKTNIQTLSKDPDMAIVIVMDISNTMTEDFGDTTRYKAALSAANSFINKYYTYAKDSSTSKLGFVAFNTDSTQIAGMTTVNTTTARDDFKTTVKNGCNAIINASGYAESHKRFTNIESGLKRGYNLIKNLPNQNKFIIFLSDGFPTTYIKKDATYAGYDPYDGSATSYSEGHFYDGYYKHPCTFGTSYSERAAVKAREQAAAIKKAGVKIFSIGIDVGGQTISQYDVFGTSSAFSIIDRPKSAREDNKYEIGTKNSGFATWLKGSATDNTVGIGSGYYYASTNSAGLTDAFTSIFESMKTITQTNSAKAWQVTDPMGTNLAFVGFYDKNGALKSTSTNLSGSFGAATENTATYTASAKQFVWNLQKSGYSLSNGTYTYMLKYRVRLTNEASGFKEGNTASGNTTNQYVTNGTTSLTYQTITTSGGNSTISDIKKINATVPAVKGYLADLTFKKQDQFGRNVDGAVFKLEHDTANCKICNGNSTSVAKSGNLSDKTATSASGQVKFTNIPSGHVYKLTETTAPTNYAKNTTAYKVTVAYDAVTHNLPSGSVVTNKKLTARVMLKKIDGTNQRDTLLPGAEFRLYTNTALTAEAKHPDGTAVGKITTDANGIADLGVLDVNATYYLKEVKPPEGYVPMDGYVTIKVADSTGAVTYIQEGNSRTNVAVTDSADPYTILRTYTLTITNNPGIELPSTGGPGTAAFYIIGSVLLTGAGLILVAGRRMSVL